MAKLVLGKKQNSKNEDFVKVWNNIEDYVSKAEITALIDETVLDIQNKTKGKKNGLFLVWRQRFYRFANRL
ncbi:hypothetical protein [Riemerella anatipestifer]|uniref:hypothetical protein n=1 Tax=Riemerella anatipestifer TaxID=34085 RepID=UPI001C86B878|nr:hypothetical protein [Riemerella anatipestifer]